MSNFSELRERRKELISQIEARRNSKVLVYFLGDRPNFSSNMASDSVRWIYDHLLALDCENKVRQIDLYLYSLGGNLDAPWQIITTLREFCETLNVLIPYKAYSAATLLALGSDNILMSKKAELGPIDPQMVAEYSSKGSQPIKTVFSVEDVTSYVAFLREKVGLTDQRALYELAKPLAETLSPMTLGQVNRTHSHIRLVARKLLSLVEPPLENVLISQIIESLTEKIYVHGHSIGRKEAHLIGLRVENMDTDLERLCWNLYLEYEKFLRLNSPAHPNAYFQNNPNDEYVEENITIACIESMNKYHGCTGRASLIRKRELTQPLNLNLNLPIQLPPNINLQQLPQQNQEFISQLFQQLQGNIIQEINRQVNEEIRKVSRVVGIDINMADVIWREVS